MRKLLSAALAAMLALSLLAGCETGNSPSSPQSAESVQSESSAAESTTSATSATVASEAPAPAESTPAESAPAQAEPAPSATSEAAAPAAQSGGTAAAPTADRAGNAIEPPAELNRIISLAPSITQTLVHLGLADKLAAIDMNSAILEGVPAGLPQADTLAPDGELLLTLDADLVLCSAMTGYDGSEPLKPLSDAGACVAVIPSSESIEGIREDLMFIADLTGLHDRGAAIVAELDAGIREVEAAVSGAPRKTVYFEIAAAPGAYSFGAGTFMNEMIEIAGGENIFADMDSWLAVSEEQVIVRNPDVIFTNVNYIDAPVDEILGRAALQGVAAVEGGQVFYVDNYSSSLANEHILKAIHEMAAAMHPDLWQGE